MANVSRKSTGSISYYGDPIAKPSGSGPCYVTIMATSFFNPASITISGQTGWTTIGGIFDGTGGGQGTNVAVLGKYVSDLASEPSTYTLGVSPSGDPRGIAVAWDNVDPSSPVADYNTDNASDAGKVPSLSNLTVGRAGSASIMACGCWNFSAWQLSGFGGSQTMPSGFSTDDPSNSTEFGWFYQMNLAGVVGGTFGASVARFGIVQFVLQPVAAAGKLYNAYGQIPFID